MPGWLVSLACISLGLGVLCAPMRKVPPLRGLWKAVKADGLW